MIGWETMDKGESMYSAEFCSHGARNLCAGRPRFRWFTRQGINHLIGVTGVILAIVALAVSSAPARQGNPPVGDLLEYEVISIDPNGWMTTAREIPSGDIVKFRLPPAVFHGQTFDAELENLGPGQRFSVKGPKNARLNGLILDDPPNGPGQAGGPGNEPAGSMLTWEILNVNGNKWIVTARNRQTHTTVRFKVHPESFAGFRFRASLHGIGKGQGFSIFAPNNAPMTNCCTMLEPKP